MNRNKQCEVLVSCSDREIWNCLQAFVVIVTEKSGYGVSGNIFILPQSQPPLSVLNSSVADQRSSAENKQAHGTAYKLM